MDNSNYIEYQILIYTFENKNDNLILLEQLNWNNIENKTIEFIKLLICTKNKQYCPCKLKLFLYVNDGIVYSDYNITPYKKINECFPEKIINFLFYKNEKCECDLEKKHLLNLTKPELIGKVIETQNQLKKINSLNNELKSQIEEKNNEINELKIKLEDIKKRKTLLYNDYKRKVEEAEELKKELISYTKKSINLNEKESFSNNISQISTYNCFEKDNNFDLNISITKFINNDNKNNKEYNKKKSYDFYDVIIDIKSIKDINKGWEIKMNERGEENYNLYKKEKIIKIGVIGNANKGKSYILSKISKIELPSGTSIRTEGLSIKYPELEEYKNRKIVLLDSAGLETPVLKEDNELINKELFKEKSRENLMTELFLQNYIIHNSDILILVVGILTYSEQKLLNRIKTEIQRAKLNKPLYIIHNLKTFVEIKQVEDYINNYLLKSATFDLEEGHKISTKIERKSGIYYYEKNSNPKIFHLIFANEQSDAGCYFNNYTLDFIENSYQQQVTDLKPFDVIKTVKERFIELSKEIIEKTEDLPLIKIENFEENNNKRIKLKNEQDIKLKQCLIDELGFSNLKTSGFEPNYNYYKKGDSIIIRVEGPGNCSLHPRIEYSGEYTIIRLTGVKKKDKEPVDDNIHNTREFGSFSLDIPLKTEDYLIKNEDPVCSDKKGLLIVEYKLDKKKEATGIEVKEEDEV